jgi:hypothetical protein
VVEAWVSSWDRLLARSDSNRDRFIIIYLPMCRYVMMMLSSVLY